MDYKKMPELNDVPDEVTDTLRAAAQYLMGNGPAPEIDTLAPELRDMVDELLPALIELVGDRIVPADEDGDEAGVPVGGRRLRQLREAADMTAQQLATAVSGGGKTITSDQVNAYEAMLESLVDAGLAQAIADALGVTADDLVDGPTSLDRVVYVDIHGTRPTAAVEIDMKPLAAYFEAQLRLVISEFGLAVRLAVLDVVIEDDLRSAAAVDTAAALLDLDVGVPLVLLVAGRDSELVTQIFDSADLREGLHAPTGDRISGPRRHPIALQDAIRYVFEEIDAEWNDGSIDVGPGFDVDVADLAQRSAAASITAVTKTTPKIEAKREAIAAINGDEIASLAAILVKVQQGMLSAGAPFRDVLESDLVGAA